MKKKLFLTMTLLATAATMFVACDEKNDDVPERTHSVTVTADSNGTVSGSDNGSYAFGTNLTFTAIPSEGYKFHQWSDGNTDNPRHVCVYTTDIAFEAQFVKSPLVTVTVRGNATIFGPESGYYAPRDTLLFTVTPSDGYYFRQWSDGNTDNPRTIKVDTSDITLTAEIISIVVDLGLTSGNLWAIYNVGAAHPWERGGRYMWGDIETNDKTGGWENYRRHCKGSKNTLLKYNTIEDYGLVDSLMVLEPVDDVATVVFGDDYTMPTDDDWEEIISQCYWVWTDNYDNKGVTGYIVYKAKSYEDKGVKIYKGVTPTKTYSLSDAHIFLPNTGYYDTDIPNPYDAGIYWSSSLRQEIPYEAFYFSFICSDVWECFSSYRCTYKTVRPVKRP